LVLLEAIPSGSLAHAEVKEVATERDVRGRLMNACDQERRTVLLQRGLQQGNRLWIHRRLGEDDGVHVPLRVDGASEHGAQEVAIEVALGHEPEEAEALEIHVLEES